MRLTILEVALGAIISILVTIFIESLRRPHLDTKIAPYADRIYQDRPAHQARFLYLRLINKPLPSLFRWLTRATALQCHGTVSFHHLDDGQNVFGRSMPIRWSGSPEPASMSMRIMVDDRRISIFDPARLIARMDVPPGEAETLDVAAKFDDEEESYGWSNESYFSDPIWRNPDWRLPSGRYLVKVTVVSAGQRITKVFRLINDVSQRDFRLEEALKTDQAWD